MRLPVLVIILGVFTAADCHDFSDEREEDPFYGDENQWLEKIPAISSDTRVSQLEEEEEMLFGDLKSDSERRVCSPTISCILAGGHCIRRGESCDGTKDPKGCSGRRCQCCIPDATPPTCPPSPTCPPPPTDTSDTIENSILKWNFVGEDYFVRFNERMTWIKARNFCTNFGLELYQPENITKVATYLADNFENDVDQNRHNVGAYNNGTHFLWLSGEVVSSDEPWAYNYTGSGYPHLCLVIVNSPYNVKDGTFLRGSHCSGHVEQLNYILCGDSKAYSLTWHSVGEDVFATYEHRMDWEDSRKLCQHFGLDLYQAKDIISVSDYLRDLPRADDFSRKYRHSWYWLGATFNGTEAFWFSGEGIPLESYLWVYVPTPSYGSRCIMNMGVSHSRPLWAAPCYYKTAYPLCG